jgi:hypothetical protein
MTGVPLGGLRPSRRDGKPGLISGEARPLGPAPTLPVKAPVNALSATASIHGGHLITFRWMPDGCRALRPACRAFWFHTGRFRIEQRIKLLDAAGYDRVT